MFPWTQCLAQIYLQVDTYSKPSISFWVLVCMVLCPHTGCYIAEDASQYLNVDLGNDPFVVDTNNWGFFCLVRCLSANGVGLYVACYLMATAMVVVLPMRTRYVATDGPP